MSDGAISYYIGMKVDYSVKYPRSSNVDGEVIEVKLMAVADGYAMVRRPRCMPYVCSVKDLQPRAK